jgi:hypothetical protein
VFGAGGDFLNTRSYLSISATLPARSVELCNLSHHHT